MDENFSVKFNVAIKNPNIGLSQIQMGNGNSKSQLSSVCTGREGVARSVGGFFTP